MKWGDTFDVEDVHMAVKAEDSSLSSCKQSTSPSTIPGAELLFFVSLAFENSEVNMLLRLLFPAEVVADEVSAIIV